MLLYLVQHAEAKAEQEDPSRGLSEKGLNDIKKTARHAARLSIRVGRIVHSGKKRALQTAQVLAEQLHPDGGVSESDGLAPMDEPAIWVERLSTAGEDIMIVGHLPHLGKFSALLVCGDENKKAVNFIMAGIVCISRDNDRSWAIDWVLNPAQLLERIQGV